MKKIDLYTFVFNDEDFLPFFLNYYRFVDRMTFIDSGSTDNTLHILNDFASSDNPIIRVTQTGLTDWNQDILHEYRNQIWKESKYDLIMFPDADKIFYHPTIKKFINENNFDIYEMDGYEMVSKTFPPKNTDILNIKTGVYHHMYNKSTIFNPKIEISFVNAHVRCSPCGNVNMGDIKLLHYRSLGLDMMKKRRDRERDRLPKNCKWRIVHDDQYLKKWHSDLMSRSITVI